MSRISYRPEIDGLRAVAVIPVILFHIGLKCIPGGFIGVDVFFVISGFLITSIIKRELDEGTFSFSKFWARRIRRILPAMLFVSACALLVTYMFVFRPDQQVIGKQAIAALLSVANIHFWRSAGDYWGTVAEESPFLHAWSLSLEEQFYFFFPLVVCIIYRFNSHWLQPCIAAATLGSLALFFWGTEIHPTATFYLLPSRVWELGTGCLLAVSLRDQSSTNTRCEIFAVVGLCMILVSYLFLDRLGGGIAIAVVGTALIIVFGQKGVCFRLLSSRPMMHVGRISYSLYLWHWPVLVLAKRLGVECDDAVCTMLLSSLTYLLSIGTYLVIERPARHRSGGVPVILVVGILVVSVAFGMWRIPRYYDCSAYAEAVYAPYNCHPDPEVYESAKSKFAMTFISNPGWRPDAYCDEGIRMGKIEGSPEVVVLGDSHGCMWCDAVAAVVSERGISGTSFCVDGVSPFMKIPVERTSWANQMTIEEKERFDHVRLKRLEEWKPRVVIIGAAWHATHQKEARELIEFLGLQGSKVLLIEDPPVFPCGDVNAMQWLAYNGVLPGIGKKKFMPSELLLPNDDGRGAVRALADSYDHVEFLPTYDLYSSDTGVLALDGNEVMFLDDDHLLQAGARKIIPRLREQLGRLLSDP